MIKITAILPARGQIDKLIRMMKSFERTTRYPERVEVLAGIDSNDEILMPIHEDLSKDHPMLKFKIFNERSDHFTKHYWNPLARVAQGRWIFPIACDHEVVTEDWDKTLVDTMELKAKRMGDDILHGLIKDNIKRVGEDALYPNFSCHPVLSKEHVNAIGYFFDERYWAWGPDHAVSWLYRALENVTGQRRIVSLTSIKIVTYDSMHTTEETNPVVLEEMRNADKNYQKFLKISQDHPCSLTPEEYIVEALKLKKYLDGRRTR